MRAHVVQRGEDLALIASRLGCSPSSIWQHADNQALREQRGQDGQVLRAGDVLYVPEPVQEGHTLLHETTNTYRLAVPTMAVQLTMRTLQGVLRNEPCIVHGPAEPIETETDGDGLLSVNVPNTVRSLQLHFPGPNIQCDVHVGSLDPVDEPTGTLQRLQNLGYLFPIDSSAYPGEQRDLTTAQFRRERLQSALQAFQHEHQLEPTGSMDDGTREALLREHGC